MLKRLRAAVPLRVSLVVATLLLAACGLAVSGIAVTSILRNSQMHRVDRNLSDATRGWALAYRAISPGPQGPTADRPPSNYYVRSMSPDGRLWSVVNDSRAEPALPANNDVGPVPVTVGSVDHSGTEWRAMTVRSTHGRVITVAYDLSDLRHTDRSLGWLQLGIGAAVLLVLGLAIYAVVSRSLQPLMEVEQTAAAIASGQLDRRVPERDPRTEVGRLSLALNGMLAQIQAAVASSESSAGLARSSEEPQRKITVDVVEGPGIPQVLGDEARLRQVLSNLMVNAVQHTPDTAHIAVRVGTKGGDAVLEVIDDGPGMEERDAQRVFERFYRADSSRARSSGGSGLGLSIVDSLVRAHGGTVAVITAPGQGCRFFVRLPRIADVAAHAESVG
jgi:HAMP domain-containing protein